jgi:hypothetical protein
MNNLTSLDLETQPDTAENYELIHDLTIQVIQVDSNGPLWEGTTTLEVGVKGILLGD